MNILAEQSGLFRSILQKYPLAQPIVHFHKDNHKNQRKSYARWITRYPILQTKYIRDSPIRSLGNASNNRSYFHIRLDKSPAKFLTSALQYSGS